MSYLIFDIETAAIPFEEFDAAQQEYLMRGCRDDAERQRQLELMSLNPLTSQVVAIGMLHIPSENDEPRAYVYSNAEERIDSTLADGATWRSMPETELLEKWWAVIRQGEEHGGLHLISFNGRNFDCPFLMLRSALLRLKPTRNLMQGTRWRYDRHTDLADELTFHNNERSGAMRRFNFDFYCKAFGLHSPKSEGVTGMDVPRLFYEGHHRDIAEYCLRDVRAAWELFRVWRDYLSAG